MMLYPPMASLVDKVGSRYLLVNLVARRARQIANEAEENGEILDKKPVSMAIDEVYSGKLTLEKTDDGFAGNGKNRCRRRDILGRPTV